jgi:rubredoxin
MKYVCELCGSVYDEGRGDARNGVCPGTLFADLPVDYECPGCGYEKEAFHPLVELSGNLQTQSHSRPKLRK